MVAHRLLKPPMGLGHCGARFVLSTGAAVLAGGGLVCRFPPPQITDPDLARAARTAPEPAA